MVVLILVAVLLGLLWGARLTPGPAVAATAFGWVVAMAAVVATTSGLDPGFWIFNSVLLLVGVGLTRVGARIRRRRTTRLAGES